MERDSRPITPFPIPTSNRRGGEAMKRRSVDAGGGAWVAPEEDEKSKRPRSAQEQPPTVAPVAAAEVVVAELGEDLVLEVLKRADALTLGRAACVSRRWRKLAEDEGVWEAVCIRDWVRVPCAKQQLRSVVLALGGFRRLHSLYILPFLTPSARRPGAGFPVLALPSVGTAASPSMTTRRPVPQPRWGKDAVQLSLSLLSIGFFEKMNRRGGGEGGGR
ncbi:F-box protein GID2-like [Canna indica]|uniref:F-box protein GID2 n=1 Tax=Canna indica TaxID=4628 RepID=A0AAQ3JMA3_9LILI|nr:F-box protein GID2-like [Canna indica]